MVDHDPLIRAAAEYLEAQIERKSEGEFDGLYVHAWSDTVYKVDGDLDLAGLVKAIMDVRKSFIWDGFKQSEAVVDKARSWEAWVRVGLEDHEQTIDAAWLREHLDTLRDIVAEPRGRRKSDA